MTLDEAKVLTLKVLKQVMEETLNSHNVQLAQVRINRCFFLVLHLLLQTYSTSCTNIQVVPKTGFSILTQDEVQTYIDQIEPSSAESGQGQTQGPPDPDVAGMGIVPGTEQGGA
jgi:20S proteasome alpha/beta subunit